MDSMIFQYTPIVGPVTGLNEETVKRQTTISVQNLRKRLKFSSSSRIENYYGWCLFVEESKGQKLFVVDESNLKPIPFSDIATRWPSDQINENVKKLRP